jgi:hypothetical protein
LRLRVRELRRSDGVVRSPAKGGRRAGLHHGLTISLYYQDPEGNYVELQSDNFSDWKQSSEWMRTSADFAANPIGTFFDPVRVYDAFQSGQDFKTLQKSVRAGAYLPNPIPSIGLPMP